MTNPYKYPFFHWATGLALCASLMAGFVLGTIVGVILC